MVYVIASTDGEGCRQAAAVDLCHFEDENVHGGFPGMKDIHVSKIAHNDQIKILFVIE